MTNFKEIKHRLIGPTTEFECKLIHRAEDYIVLRYDIVGTKRWQVGDITLMGGTITYAHYWLDLPYNVYHWILPNDSTAGYYFNISDRTQISSDLVTWRDLVVDILVTPDGRCQILDEDELPTDLDDTLAQEIELAKSLVVRDARRITDAIESMSRRFHKPLSS